MTRPVEALAGAAVLLCAAGGAAIALRAAGRATATAARATGRRIAGVSAAAWRPIARVARGRAARQIASLQGIQADQAAAIAGLVAALLAREERYQAAARGPAPAAPSPPWYAQRAAQRVLEATCRVVQPTPAAARAAPRQKPPVKRPTAAAMHPVVVLGPDELSALVLGLERRPVSQ